MFLMCERLGEFNGGVLGFNPLNQVYVFNQVAETPKAESEAEKVLIP